MRTKRLALHIKSGGFGRKRQNSCYWLNILLWSEEFYLWDTFYTVSGSGPSSNILMLPFQQYKEEWGSSPWYLTCSCVWASSTPSACRILSVPLLSSVFRPTPSISFSSTDRRRVCTLLAPWLFDRAPIRESISSRNRRQGAHARAWENSCVWTDRHRC